MMRTLGSWVGRFGGKVREIACPVMKLFVGRNDDPPAMTGFGIINWEQPTAPSFTMTITDERSHAARVCLADDYKVSDHRLDGIVLEAVDQQGSEWNCGWVAPKVDPSSRTLTVRGSIERMRTLAVGANVSPVSSAELFFDPAPRLPMAEWRTTTVALGEEVLAVRRDGGRQRLEVLGSSIEIARDEWTDGVWVIASVSPDMPHPYLEGWLSEPLRILCGQLIYPRLVARNTGDGRAHVSLQRTCSLQSRVGGLRSSLGQPGPDSFWDFYKRCLQFLARHRDDKGDPLFGANHLSRFHEEVIQAAGSSEWVLALAASSAIEGLCRLAVGPTGLQHDFEGDDLKKMQSALRGAPCSEGLKKKMISNLDYLGRPSVGSFLRSLVGKGVISTKQRDAWMRVRNKAAHGNLDAANSAADDHDSLSLLIQLLNDLTRHVVASR